MWLSFWAVAFFLRFSEAGVSDAQYGLMPELFYLDNFDQCMLKGEAALFCVFTFELGPTPDTNSKIWEIIKNVSDNPLNYRHDQLRHGICVPETCKTHYNDSSNTITQAIQACYNEKLQTLGLGGNVVFLHCQTPHSDYPVDVYDIAFGAILFVYCAFVVFASIYERHLVAGGESKYLVNSSKNAFQSTGSDRNTYTVPVQAKSNSKKNLLQIKRSVGAFISAFSVPKNWYRLRSTTSNPDHRKLRSIQGMRFYTIMCVVAIHTIMNHLGGPVANPQYTENITKPILNMLLINGWYVVQTFFVISGWLLAYHFFMETSKIPDLKLSYLVWIILQRFVRLAPAIAVMVGFHGTWLVHMGRGPYWDQFIGEETRNCRKNWWTNLLFVNNYVDKLNMCLQQTWYVAAEMQLFVGAVFVLYFVKKYPSLLKYAFSSMCFVGILIPGIIAYVNKYDIIVRQYPETMYNLNALRLEYWHQLYSSGYSNIATYSIGVIFGYLFYQHRSTTFPIRMVHKILWWIFTFGMCLSVVLIAVVFYDPSFVVTPLNSAVYWSAGKTLFALGIAIGIFGFSQKIGWFARWFIEYPPVEVLGRLTYSTYITHVAYSRLQLGYRRYPVAANDAMMFLAVLGDITLAYLTGTVFCLLVEMPISALQKLWNSGGDGKPRTMVRKSSEKSLETLDMSQHNINV
ncbi:nose resistant to fluoxetine protein 6 isoform X2 [Dendroctonus ponderosae]|uniref:nose resistant to fluoxetine protein 6 isoform X2 n=1 Tax=Dendroctonus ponderosae TaxID=77166 RepID=UPI00203656BD|nr:nose resistant to fluoxetine protein 6 isoform X2 [Dendroctonus ponderosae]